MNGASTDDLQCIAYQGISNMVCIIVFFRVFVALFYFFFGCLELQLMFCSAPYQGLSNTICIIFLFCILCFCVFVFLCFCVFVFLCFGFGFHLFVSFGCDSTSAVVPLHRDVKEQVRLSSLLF
eukprot:Phypoly_transcript_18560.p1 GENE.Phypoly_transcript_18560~~Phypoly_transcript_18560.p1  ORF type:complete len:123 (+),score=2.75 Phypoly_transcript_18560:258-626(+)